ncbi:adenine DNA glycosylase [Aplysia californica]|uniref:Adenine DNA glycosylase n=1 Tax=Aplysia californica TaxID=6500 RepID=A0ABM0K086_APLCA|nr:adenine DNA glycosylase [Aplysia californica]
MPPKKARSKSQTKSKPKSVKKSGCSCTDDNMSAEVGFHDFSATEISQMRQNLLSWYDKKKRDLPWRNITTEDVNQRAYAVWVSEIMLQQTRVATVINYYNRWMKKWPTIQALASADSESVNDAWAGLGYYSRGQRLLDGAKKVVEELDSQVPQTAQDLEKQLPGVGRYTAGAIASIAFGQATGLVDGNVIRVLSRLRMIGGNIKQPNVVDAFWSLANKLVDPDRPGDFNQSMMELGATVCTPTTPACEQCPVKSLCRAYSKVERLKKSSSLKLCTSPKVKDEKPALVDIECLVPDCKLCLPAGEPWKKELGVTNFPRKPKKGSVRQETLNVVLLCNKTNSDSTQQYLICKRPKKGLLAGLWEFPNQIDENGRQDVIPFVASLLNMSQENIQGLQLLGGVSHQFSHIRHMYKVWSAHVSLTPSQTDQCVEECTDRPLKWMTNEQLKGMAIPTGMLKVFDKFKEMQDEESKKASKRKNGDQDDVIVQEPKKSQRAISDFFKQRHT